MPDLSPPPCFCPIGTVESELIFSPDWIPLPHPETPNWEAAVETVRRENERRQEAHRATRRAEDERVRAETEHRRQQREQCPSCSGSWLDDVLGRGGPRR